MLEITRLAPLKLRWAFEEPFGNNQSRSRHYVEDVYDTFRDLDGEYSDFNDDVDDYTDFEDD
jgi:hypothetical protein